MADVLNLRTARKQRRRAQDEKEAESRRLAHGQPASLRKLRAQERTKAERDLEGHRIERGDEQ